MVACFSSHVLHNGDYGNMNAAHGAAQATCRICFDEFDVKNMRAARCKHFFCKPCWRGYISTAISCGPSVLSLRCPLPDCSAAVSGLLSQVKLALCQQLTVRTSL